MLEDIYAYEVEPAAQAVTSVGAYLDGSLISRGRAEELLSASITAGICDGTAYRVSLGLDGTPSVTPPLTVELPAGVWLIGHRTAVRGAGR